MTSDEIRQKAREYRKQWSHKPTAIPSDSSGLWYSEECTDDLMTDFAESILSGGAEENREFDISIHCGHCNTVNYAVRSLKELEINEWGAVSPIENAKHLQPWRSRDGKMKSHKHGWDDCNHEWQDVEDISGRGVKCVKCECPGEREILNPEVVHWPAT